MLRRLPPAAVAVFTWEWKKARMSLTHTQTPFIVHTNLSQCTRLWVVSVLSRLYCDRFHTAFRSATIRTTSCTIDGAKRWCSVCTFRSTSIYCSEWCFGRNEFFYDTKVGTGRLGIDLQFGSTGNRRTKQASPAPPPSLPSDLLLVGKEPHRRQKSD